MAAITMAGICKCYSSLEVIHGIDLEVEDGEFVTLVGPSGCGKSTLLRMIAGLEDITSGDMRFDGKRVNELAPAEREIAMVFQSYALYPHLSVRKNLSFGLENLRMDRGEINRRVDGAAKMLDIEPYLERKPKALSGGQRQRVAIGRAIVRNPRVFLFDEPLSNLDAKLRVQTRSEIVKLHKKLETTMVYVTHDQVEAMTMSEKIVVLNGGNIEQVGRPLDLFERPANVFVAGFIGSPRMNMYRARVVAVEGSSLGVESPDTGRIDLDFHGHLPTTGSEVTLGIRPSHLHVTKAEGGRPFTVEGVESMGHETFVYGRIGDSAVDTILHVPGHLDVDIEEVIPVHFDPEFMHVFDVKDGRSLRQGTS